jgi:hypothetical protein
MRPSTTQLDLNLRTLVAEFALRDMGCTDVSLFLACSPSSARNYINRLFDAGIVAPRRAGGTGGRGRTVYRMKPCARMADLPCIGAAPGGDRRPAVAVQAAVCHDPQAPPMMRDPLVAALFGRPSAAAP